MSANYLSDLLAQFVYPATFVVCLTWVGIAVAQATNGARLCNLMLALAMFFSAIAFGLLAYNAGRHNFSLEDILILFRAAMAMATVFGATFTILYLWKIRKKGKRYVQPHK